MLVRGCPSFADRWHEGLSDDYLDSNGTLLDYIALGDLARHLIDLYTDGKHAEFPAFFGVVERLHREGDPYVLNAVVVGLLEGIQNDAGHTNFDPNLFLKWCGPETKRWFDRLNDFWSGKRPLVNDAILILEDDQERIDHFVRALSSIDPNSQIIFWRSAKKMIEEVDRYLPIARLISLDHDLRPAAGETEDPGDGLDVARHLALRTPKCPIIIHSSNGERARRMQGEFELARCRAKVVAPLGADWIEADWAQVARSLLVVRGSTFGDRLEQE